MTDTRDDAVTRVTIADVARSAGVSVPTVSKVLNDRSDVSADTRERVRGAISSQGYRRRSTPGQGTGRATLVELLLSDLDSPYAVEVLSGAEAGASRAGAGLVVTASHEHHRSGRQWLSGVAARRPRGVVLVVNQLATTGLGRLEALGVPVVLLDPVGGSDPRLPTVGATNFAGGVAATEHLLGLGHRRVAVVTGLPYLLCSQERLEGYRAAMARHGLAVDEELVHHGDFQPGGGQRAAAALLDLADPPTAIFAGSDMQASGVYQEVRARGLHVPGDLSVVGFDDVSVCRYLSPPLSTVRQPLADMAAEAVRMVLELAVAEDEQASRTRSHHAPPHLQLTTRFVERESTAPPRR